MLFNSLPFFIFLAVVFGLYLFLSHRWQNRLLIVASCFFYASWNWKFLILMFVSITTDFWCAKYIASSGDTRLRKRLLFLSIFVNLAILGFFKYANFFLGTVNGLLGGLLPQPLQLPFRIILPLGISFYTFEAISYTVDVYRGIARPAKFYSEYLLFVIYFPHLIAGPIMRARNFLPQIIQPRILSWDGFYEGCFLAFWGYFEKVFVADNLAKIVNPVFGAPPPYDGGLVLVAMYAFAFQIFCDFDGYSNIARGLGKIMGFDISINFKLPYFATNPGDFWRRWHITLSSWLRDYLYIPLGGNRCSKFMVVRNLMTTMLLGGLWHGASWTFVIWGAYHGFLLVAHRLMTGFKDPTEKLAATLAEKSWVFIKGLVFFNLVCLGWLFFRARTFAQIGAMLHSLFLHFHLSGAALYQGATALLIVLPLLFIQIGQAKTKDLMFLYQRHWLLKTAVYALMAYLMLGWGIMRAQEFIYFQF